MKDDMTTNKGIQPLFLLFCMFSLLHTIFTVQLYIIF